MKFKDLRGAFKRWLQETDEASGYQDIADEDTVPVQQQGGNVNPDNGIYAPAPEQAGYMPSRNGMYAPAPEQAGYMPSRNGMYPPVSEQAGYMPSRNGMYPPAPEQAGYTPSRNGMYPPAPENEPTGHPVPLEKVQKPITPPPFVFRTDTVHPPENNDKGEHRMEELTDRDEDMTEETGAEPSADSVSEPQYKVVISLLLDTTKSMSKIYARVYHQMMKEIYAMKSLKDISLTWRLSYIGCNGYQYVGDMTSEELKKTLDHIILRGGAHDGYEEIIEPLKQECAALTDVGADVKGLLMLTDTVGKQPVAQDEKNRADDPLDFCILYLYADEKNGNFDDYIAVEKKTIRSIASLLFENNLPKLKEEVQKALKNAGR